MLFNSKYVLVVVFSSLSLLGCNDSVAKSEVKHSAMAESTKIERLAANPHLVINSADVDAMRIAITKKGRFQQAFLAQKKDVDSQIAEPITVPVPKDGGGGYTHERHKKNYKLMYDAGVLFQLTQDVKYANYVRDMLFEYAAMYPTLPRHPMRKSRNEGKLFWQGLNEAVWLVHTIQAYDFILSTLSKTEINTIETGIIRPVALFLSEESSHTFNLVHNHGTWATAAVGMTGYVIGELEWVEKALYDLEKSGEGGFLKQLDKLFSPEGYYNEGPYYQRYALMPFVTFAKAIEQNEPERKIFEYRNGIVQKAINTTIQLSYNKLFFPINDSIKDKGIDTIELVNGVAIAYGLTKEPGLLEIAEIQDQIILTGEGLKIAEALDNGLTQSFDFKSIAYGDGFDGTEGALVIMRETAGDEDQAVLFKPAAQGLGHGHFDKLTWQFYDKGEEIVSDYGAARFLNVEAKYGGRYLPENDSYAKHTIAHNTVVVDETTHFKANVKVGNANHPNLLFFAQNENGKISSAEIDSAYEGVNLKRTIALLTLQSSNTSLVVDVFSVSSDKAHQYDLPLHFKGHLIDTNFELGTFTQSLSALGEKDGYQHLWLKAKAKPEKGLAQVTFLNKNGRFYSQSTVLDGNTEILFTQIGANDPLFNLRNEKAFITRVQNSKSHSFVNVFEPHGEYNPSKEYTLNAVSSVKNIVKSTQEGLTIVDIEMTNGGRHVLAFNQQKVMVNQQSTFTYNGQTFEFTGQFTLFDIQK